MTKSNPGHYFEDFKPGMELVHATPLTVSAGDISLYRALTGARHALYSAETFAAANGFPALPVDPLLAFHVLNTGSTWRELSLQVSRSELPRGAAQASYRVTVSAALGAVDRRGDAAGRGEDSTWSPRRGHPGDDRASRSRLSRGAAVPVRRR